MAAYQYLKNLTFGAEMMKRNERAGRKKQRRINSRTPNFERILIISEGIKTEKSYFESIIKHIQERFRENMILDKVDLDIKGTGRGTMKVVEYALKSRNRHTYSQVWVVIDKDLFNDFDEAIKKAEDEGLFVAWSNQSFELWYLLHFQDVTSTMDNITIINKLSAHLQQNDIQNEPYSKSKPLSFLDLQSSIDLAIQRSERLLKNHQAQGNELPSKMNPATTVSNLINIIKPYVE